LVRFLREHIPHGTTGYVEPFVGGGALLFAVPTLQFRVIADANLHLINTYHQITTDVEAVIAELEALEVPRSSAEYRTLADRCLNSPTGAAGAAAFIATVKSTWGAKWEIDAGGKHRGSWSKRATPLCEADKLRSCAKHLAGVSTHAGDAVNLLESLEVPDGTLVYLDPPYLPENGQVFDGYTSAGFGVGEHRRLAEWISSQDGSSVRVMLSMSDTPVAREIYHGLDFRRTSAARRLHKVDGVGVDLVGVNYPIAG
jgi:DNA adenine methylase